MKRVRSEGVRSEVGRSKGFFTLLTLYSFLFTLCSCSQVFLQVRAPESGYAVKRLAILPFSVAFETAEPQPSVKRPLNLGFSQSVAGDLIGVRKIPATLEEKEKVWFGEYSRVKLFVGDARAKSLARELTFKCYERISRGGGYERLVNPDQVMEKLKQKVESGKLSASDLKRLGMALGVETLLVGSITRYETDVTRHAYKSHERFVSRDAPTRETTSLRYVYRCALKVSLFDVVSSTFVWTGEAWANYDNITDDLAQDFTLALTGRGQWGEFMKHHFLGKITENTPLERCLKGLLAKMPK